MQLQYWRWLWWLGDYMICAGRYKSRESNCMRELSYRENVQCGWPREPHLHGTERQFDACVLESGLFNS